MSARIAPDWPRMLRRTAAALYCGLTVSEFEREVAIGRLPMPVNLAGKESWSRVQIDECLDRLTGEKVPDWRDNAKLYRAG